MKIKLLILVCFICGVTNAQSHICGMSAQEQVHMDEIFTRAGIDPTSITKRGDKLYIPMRFHIVSDDNGKGGVSYGSILNQLARLNDDYASHNFVFYLKDNYNFGTLKNSIVTNNPRDNETILNGKRDTKAINVYVVKNIGGSGVGTGIVLGYYSPTNDFLVLMQSEADKSSNTLSHEVGHFFNLRHTFNGWESEPYEEALHGNPCLLSFAPGSNIQVETVDMKNCKVAADLVCDTPPDFNFGLTAGNCIWGKSIKDKNGDLIVPMKNNQMSYFSDCPEFVFTKGQEDRMRTNYGNFQRSYIKSTYVPITDTLPPTSKIITPINNSKENVYTSVYFEWEDQKASTYLLEIKSTTDNKFIWVQGKTNYTATDLLPNKNYFWSVRGFHDGYTNTTSPVTRFITGNLMTATNDFDEIDAVNVYPNPVKINQKISFDLSTKSGGGFKINLEDINGKIIQNKEINLTSGTHQIFFDEVASVAGVYFIKISNDQNFVTKKLIVQN